MGWASEMMIEAHNARMESDADYAEECRREWELEDYCRELAMADETQTDWFDDYRVDHSGYEEIDLFDEHDNFIDDGLPF